MVTLRYIAKLLQSVERIESDSLKLLGVTIDCELSFNKHVSDVCMKASQRIGHTN